MMRLPNVILHAEKTSNNHLEIKASFAGTHSSVLCGMMHLP